MRDRCASHRPTWLHSDRAHMSVVCVVSIGMMQANVNAKIDFMILWIPPTRIDDLICICRGIYRPIRDAIVDTIVTIVPDPVAQTIRPISPTSRIANTGLWRRCSRRRGGWTVLIRHIACEYNDLIIECIVWRGMIENRFDRGRTRIGRIQKRCNSQGWCIAYARQTRRARLGKVRKRVAL